MADFGPIMGKYTGSEDPKAWINTYINSLDAAGIRQSSRHVYFSRNLEGPAFKWYIEEVPLADKPYWDKLRAAFETKWTPLFKHAQNRNQASITLSTNLSTHSTPATQTPSEDTATEKLYRLAITSPNSPLGQLWKRSFEKGVEEGIKKGKEKYYGKGIVVGENDEHKRWIAAGHSERCSKSATTDDAGAQTDPPAIATSVSTQTTTLTLRHTSPLSTAPLTATSSKTSTNDTISAPTATAATQANAHNTPILPHATVRAQTKSPAANIDTTSPNLKTLVLNKYTTDSRAITTNGVPLSPATCYDEEITQTDPHFPPFHDPSHLSVATSPLPVPADYVNQQHFRKPDNGRRFGASNTCSHRLRVPYDHCQCSYPRKRDSNGRIRPKAPKRPEIAHFGPFQMVRRHGITPNTTYKTSS
jgi:hypothetical protein